MLQNEFFLSERFHPELELGWAVEAWIKENMHQPRSGCSTLDEEVGRSMEKSVCYPKLKEGLCFTHAAFLNIALLVKELVKCDESFAHWTEF